MYRIQFELIYIRGQLFYDSIIVLCSKASSSRAPVYNIYFLYFDGKKKES